MARKIKTTPSVGNNLKISGKLAGQKTYLQVDGLGVIEGAKLYRLAKAIVRQFEPEQPQIHDNVIYSGFEY